MRIRCLGSVAGLLAGASLGLAQSPLPVGPPSAANPGSVVVVDLPSAGSGVPTAPVSGLGVMPLHPGGCPTCGGGPGGGNCLNGDSSSPYISRPCFSGPACATCGGAGNCLQRPEEPSPYLPHTCPPDPPPLPHPGDPAPTCVVITGGLDYLLWTVKRGPEPVPLVTTAPGLSRGVIGAPDTQVLDGGGGSVNYHEFSGLRLLVDLWHDDSRSQGVEASAFSLTSRSNTFTAASDPNGSPTISVPYHDALTNTNMVSFVSFPGAFAGRVTVTSQSNLWGAEGNLVWKAPWLESNQNNIWLLGGARYLNLSENLSIGQNTTLLPGGAITLPDGTTQVLQGGQVNFPGVGTVTAPGHVLVNDQFHTLNQFWGLQGGFRAEVQRGDAFAVLTAKVALGETHEILSINGSSALSPGGPNSTVLSGLYAVGSNSGRSYHDIFAFVPEVGLQVGYYLTPHIRGTLGYDIVYWSQVIRPGDQIDPNINRAQVPTSNLFGNGGPAFPARSFHQTDFYANGLTVGLDFSY